MYKHIKVPEGGQKITVNADFSLNVPTSRSFRTSRATAPGQDITPVMLKVVDAAVAKSYGGKRKIHWMEVYAGEKSTKVYGPDVWLPEETLARRARVRGVDQGPADDAGGRRHPLAQRGAAPGTRPLRLPAPDPVLQGRAQPGEGAARRPTWSSSARTRKTSTPASSTKPRRDKAKKLIKFLIDEMGVTKIRFPEHLGHRHQAGVARRHRAPGAQGDPVRDRQRQAQRHDRAQGQHHEVHRRWLP